MAVTDHDRAKAPEEAIYNRSFSGVYVAFMALGAVVASMAIFLGGVIWLSVSPFRIVNLDEMEMDVSLPPASEAMPLIVQPMELFINIDKDGGYLVRRQEMSFPQIEAHLKESVANNPSHSVIVRADKRCLLDDVVQVINLCNRLRIEYSLTTTGEAE